MVVELQTLEITVLILIDELTGINLILETDEDIIFEYTDKSPFTGAASTV